MKSLADCLSQWIHSQDYCLFGEVSLTFCEESGLYRARHVDDLGKTGLTELVFAAAVRDMTKFDSSGNYRPLRTAPGMKNGWEILDRSPAAFYEKCDALYPASLAGSVRYLEGEVDPVPLRETLNRQTGMYRFAKNITDHQANQVMRDLCSAGCLRKIAWPIDVTCACSRFGSEGKRIPIVCLEACTFAVTEARRIAREAYDKANAPG